MRMVAAISGGLTVQVDWLGLRVVANLLAANRRLVCIHQMNLVNSRINIISVIINIIIT